MFSWRWVSLGNLSSRRFTSLWQQFSYFRHYINLVDSFVLLNDLPSYPKPIYVYVLSQDGRAVQGAAFRSQSSSLGVGSNPTSDINFSSFCDTFCTNLGSKSLRRWWIPYELLYELNYAVCQVILYKTIFSSLIDFPISPIEWIRFEQKVSQYGGDWKNMIGQKWDS